MARRSPIAYSLLLTVSQALWVLPAVPSASAQVPLPPNFISPNVPHDVPTGSGASIQDLAIFAWREFIALNWVAMDPTATGVRGRPNGTDPIAGFVSIHRDSATGSFPLLVWHTYRHKNELFPYYKNAQTDPNFDSKLPTYVYDPAPTVPQGTNFQLFNNLDETSEIGVCTMFAHNTTRIIYEAKVSRAAFDYANKNQLTNHDVNGNYPTLTAAKAYTAGNLAQYGGICSTDPSIVSLPCGDNTVAGDPGEGAIEIKAAWRELTVAEANSQPPGFSRKILSITLLALQTHRWLTMRSTGWSLCTSSIKQNRFRHLCSQAGSRLTITMMGPTRTPRVWRLPISGTPHSRSLRSRIIQISLHQIVRHFR